MLNNYRPISLLSVFSKILEKAVKRRLLDFLDENEFFSPNQYGFREKMGTEDALYSFLSDVFNYLNNNKQCFGLFVDVTKAFDMVVHSILLKVMESAGIRGLPLKWFESYLENRILQTKIGDEMSGEATVNIGVPQGSVLGPIMFLIYFNSLLFQKFMGKLVAFADDVAFVYEGSNTCEIKNKMDQDLSIISKWFNSHCLVLSSKTKVMEFKRGNINNRNNFILKYHISSCDKICCSSEKCFSIEEVSTFNYLGIVLDGNLNWKPHCASVKQYINMCLCRFYMLRSLVPADILNRVYFALIQSKLSYGLPFWGGAYNSTLKPIVIGQNFLLRTMCFKRKYTSAWSLYCTRKILPLKHLYVFRVLKLFFSKSGNRLSKIIKQYNLRNNNLCFIPKINYTQFQKCFLVSAPNLFNNIPDTIQSTINITKFCALLKEYLFSISDINVLYQ